MDATQTGALVLHTVVLADLDVQTLLQVMPVLHVAASVPGDNFGTESGE